MKAEIKFNIQKLSQDCDVKEFKETNTIGLFKHENGLYSAFICMTGDEAIYLGSSKNKNLLRITIISAIKMMTGAIGESHCAEVIENVLVKNAKKLSIALSNVGVKVKSHEANQMIVAFATLTQLANVRKEEVNVTDFLKRKQTEKN